MAITFRKNKISHLETTNNTACTIKVSPWNSKTYIEHFVVVVINWPNVIWMYRLLNFLTKMRSIVGFSRHKVFLYAKAEPYTWLARAPFGNLKDWAYINDKRDELSWDF